MRRSHHPHRPAACGSAQLRTSSWIPKAVTSSCAEPAKLCHLSVSLSPPPPFFSDFLHSSFVSTPAQCIPHINPHGHDNPHYVFMSCSLLSPSISLCLLHSCALSFVLFAPIAHRLKSRCFFFLKKKQTKIEKERIGGDIKNTVNHLNSPWMYPHCDKHMKTLRGLN